MNLISIMILFIFSVTVIVSVTVVMPIIIPNIISIIIIIAVNRAVAICQQTKPINNRYLTNMKLIGVASAVGK